MTQKLSDRKTPSAEYGNCITNERDAVQSNVAKLQVKHDDWESKQTFVVTQIECRGKSYRRIKKGETIPEGAILHYGKI